MEITRSPVYHILVVDDDADTREILEHMLSDFGCVVWLSGTTYAGIQVVESGEKFDAVLIDYRMPIMNGIEFMRRVKDKINCPLIMVTGFGSKRVREEATNAGADAFAEKPLPPSSLEKLVRATIAEFAYAA
jgi:CheY-like chemotaxis protein